MAVGDIISEIGYRVRKLTEDGTAAITKGQLSIIRVGKIKLITASTDKAPYAVPIEDFAKSGTGRALVDGVIEMTEDNSAALTLGDNVIPGATTLGTIKKGATGNISSNYVQAAINEILFLGVGEAYEDISKNAVGPILLGNRLGRAD